MRYFLELSYDGTDFAGWQRQSNANAVQACIEDALSKIMQRDIDVTGCGRTDKGVHARYFVAHCDLDVPKNNILKLKYKLNRMLPSSIACSQLRMVHSDAHTRYDALSRTYEYHLHGEKNPFLKRFSTYYSAMERLDRTLLKEVAQLIGQTSDCASFCKAHSDNKTTICHIMESSWSIDASNNTLIYRIRADRFLRGMVRLIVGSTLNVASGKLNLKEFTNHVKNGSRSPLMKSAPPEGLALVAIEYPYFKQESLPPHKEGNQP